MACSDPALCTAAAHGRNNEVLMLLGKGDDVQETTRSGDSALHGAALGSTVPPLGRHGATLLQLLNHGAHLDATNNGEVAVQL